MFTRIIGIVTIASAVLFVTSTMAQTGGSINRPKPASLKIDAAVGSAPGARSPVSVLQQNAKLASRLATFFPDGTDLSKMAAGFKNLGQFVSAVHVSHNLAIPFDDLKCAELGTIVAGNDGASRPASIANSDPMILGKTIQMLRPKANAQREIQEADSQGEKDLQDSARK